MRRAILAAGLWAVANVALAASSDQFESPVYETAGDHQTLTKRANVCMVKILRPGIVTAPTVLTVDPDSGIVVANSQFQYGDSGSINATDLAKAKVTFQAKDGRFRFTTDEIEIFDRITGWTALAAYKSRVHSLINVQVDLIAGKVADCVKKAPSDF